MPKSKFTVYCEVDFLETLYDKIAQPLSDLIQSQGLQNRGLLYELVSLIHEHSQVVINLNDDELDRVINNRNEDYNPILIDFILDEKSTLINDALAFEQMETDENFFQKLNFPQALFFLSSSPEICHQLCEDYGYIFISKDEIDEKIPFLFNFDIQNLVRNQQPKSWAFLQKYRHPFNAMVIADNYILNRRYEENLFAILKNLMPQTLNNQVFHLTIIVNDEATVSNEERQSINEFLEEEFNYAINLTILKSSRLHDRNILTNYIWISSPYGFELFHNQNILENRETQVKMFPITYLKRDFKGFFSGNTSTDLKNTILETVDYLLNKSKEINENTINILPNTINVYGNKINRLLD